MKSPLSRAALLCLAYAVLHVAAQLSARLFAVSPGVSLWYPPAGLALSLLVMLGPRYAWVVLLTNVGTAYLLPGYAKWWAPLLFPAVITMNYTVAALLIRRWIGQRMLPGTAPGTLAFTTAVMVPPIGATVAGTAVLLLMGEPLTEPLHHHLLVWWIGDLSGVLTLLPLAIVYVAPWLEGKPHPAQCWRWDVRSLGGFLLEAGALIGALWLSFSQKLVLPHNTLYVCFLPLIWICFRHGLPGATLATLALAMGALIGMREVGGAVEEQIIGFLLFGVSASVLGLGLGSAVTRRNDAIAELSASRARFDRVLEGAQLGLWDWNLTAGEIVYNRRCAELLRLDASERLTEERWETAIHPADRARNRAALETHLAGKSALYENEYRIQTADGRWRWIHSRGSVVQRTTEGRPELVSGTHADVTERKLAESTSKRLLTIIETSTDFVVTVDPHGHVLYANAALLRLLGTTNARGYEGLPFVAVFPRRSADILQAEVIPHALAHGSWHGELTLRNADQQDLPTSVIAVAHRDADSQGSLLSFVMRDISAQKQAEAANLERERRILQVQKAESLSVLTGGIAHDFNNLLTAIIGNAALLREDLPAGSLGTSVIGHIETAAVRAAELCSSMLAYSGRVRLTPTEVNFNKLVDESLELIQAAISKKIRIETTLGQDVPPVKGSPSQLQQVIINLALNANDAIGEAGGLIRIRTSYRPADRGRAAPRPGGGGALVVLEVEDNGAGIPPELRQRIFEPFFTTKPNGHGLGLAAVNGIVRGHGGWVTVEESRPRGALFRIHLPALEPEVVPDQVSLAPSERCHGSGLALIVDDESLVRDVVCRLVERLGFKTISARDGAEAVALFQQHQGELRFVLTDLTMPRMNGDEAMVEMRRINPNVPVILMSGYPEKMAADHFALASPSALLVKPIRMAILEKAISQVTAVG